MTVATAEQWEKAFRRTLRASATVPDRYPRGSVFFWDSDILRGPLADVAVANGWNRRATLEELGIDPESATLSDEARQYLRDHIRSLTVEDAVGPRLREFSESTGLPIAIAAEVRRFARDRLAESSNESKVQPSTSLRRDDDRGNRPTLKKFPHLPRFRRRMD
jgi:hypothetical protein